MRTRPQDLKAGQIVEVFAHGKKFDGQIKKIEYVEEKKSDFVTIWLFDREEEIYTRPNVKHMVIRPLKPLFKMNDNRKIMDIAFKGNNVLLRNNLRAEQMEFSRKIIHAETEQQVLDILDQYFEVEGV